MSTGDLGNEGNEGYGWGDFAPFPSRHLPLIIKLESDFTPPKTEEDLQVLGNDNSHFMDRLIAFSPRRPSHDVAKIRYSSPVAEQIAIEARHMLEEASITSTFKHRIADEVRRSYAEERSVSGDISPKRLGLTDDRGGIFDADQAPEIEARHIRYRVVGIVGQHLRIPKRGRLQDGQEITVLRPADYSSDMQELKGWMADYNSKFKVSPLDELSQKAYGMASKVYGEMSKRR